MTRAKSVRQLTIKDFQEYPIWEYGGDLPSETRVHPVTSLPVDTLDNRVIGTQVRLSNGMLKWAVLTNISVNDARRTQHFLTLALKVDGKWFDLARYFDIDYQRRSPERLAELLHLPINEVFPIIYDITGFVLSDTSILKGSIPAEPTEKLTQAELIRMSVWGN